jgi:Fur family peroxide stress response transcriptional regulator
VTDHTRDHRVALLAGRCRERGLPLTPQRLAILRAVVDLDDHPSADRVHDALVRRRLRVSRATVYRTLESLARAGVLKKASHTGGCARYDGRLEHHHHLVCTRCERVLDFSDAHFDALPLPDTRGLGFAALEIQVQVRGLCSECREQEDKP